MKIFCEGRCKWTNKRRNAWTNEWMKQWMTKWPNDWMTEWIEEFNARTNKRMNVRSRMMSCLHEAEIHFSAGTPISIVPTLSLVPCSLLIWSIFPTQQLLTGLNWIKRYTWMYWFIIGPRNPKITSWKIWPFSCGLLSRDFFWLFCQISGGVSADFFQPKMSETILPTSAVLWDVLVLDLQIFLSRKDLKQTLDLSWSAVKLGVQTLVKQVVEHAMFYPPIWEHPLKRGCYSSCPVQMLQKTIQNKKWWFKLHGVRLSNFWKVVPNSIRPTGRKEFEASIVPTVVLC